MKKLYPHEVRGEGHFYAVMEKKEGDRRDKELLRYTFKDKKLLSPLNDFVSVGFDNLCKIGDAVYSLPENMPKIKRTDVARRCTNCRIEGEQGRAVAFSCNGFAQRRSRLRGGRRKDRARFFERTDFRVRFKGLEACYV